MKTPGIYAGLPVALQNVACSLYGLREARVRYGAEFRRRLKWLSETESASREEIDGFQAQEIRRVIRHASENVPHYRRIMEVRGLKPSAISSRAELNQLPMLTKREVVRERRGLVSTGVDPGRLREASTSGTTGSALSFYTTREAISFQWAIWWRHRGRFGIKPGTWHVNFTGKPVVPISQRKLPYWRWNWPMRQALVGMQHVTPEKVRHMASLFERRRFEFFSGYPSIVASFCDALLDLGATSSNLPGFVFLGAEPVLAQQRRVIEEATGAVVTDQYGFSEGCGNASRCEMGRYHEDWEFGVLECADPEPQPDGSVRGKIVATGFANYAFPFIRYEVGDSAVWEPEEFRCECGRNSRVIREIEGRLEDYVVTPEGAQIKRFDYLFKDTRDIKEAQVVQRRQGEIIVRFIPRAGFSVTDEEAIRRKVREWISPGLQVEFESVKEIPRTQSGKFRPVVSELQEA